MLDMQNVKPVVLLVEDSLTMATLYKGYLSRSDCDVVHAETGGEALNIIESSPPDLILLDLNLPDISGMDILKSIHQSDLPVDVIVITAENSAEFAFEAIRLGALDYLVKPFDGKRLLVTVNNALKQREMSSMLTKFRENFTRDSFHGFIGASLEIQSVYKTIEAAASSKATIFITGESGTGKEVCAHAIHEQSNRKSKPFIAINCAAIPKDLIESEIFGHVKGAFTGAVSAREGAASRADGGTLFLDEVCEMDLELQTKLLRFTQTGTLQKVGGSKEESVDVRIVCATNRDPLEEVKQGRFREDLYFRLHVIPIVLPALRQRGNDCLLIADYFLNKYAGEEGKRFRQFDDEVREVFVHYDWPGNVRQLQNLIRQVVVLNEGNIITREMLPDMESATTQAPISSVMPEAAPAELKTAIETDVESAEVIRPLWVEEKEIIERAIRICDDNVPKAAAMLDISPSTIYRKKQSWQKMQA